MAITKLEDRLTRLEAEVEALKRGRAGVVSDKKPWWVQISGVFKDCPEFEEAMRLGREWRESQRMEYDEDAVTQPSAVVDDAENEPQCMEYNDDNRSTKSKHDSA